MLDQIAGLSGGAAIENAAIAQKPDEGPRGECPAREAEDEDFIIGLLVEDEKAVRVRENVHDSDAEHSPEKVLSKVVSAANALVVEHRLRHVVPDEGHHAFGREHHVSGVRLGQALPSAVKTKH